jgi:hypothetical protein
MLESQIVPTDEGGLPEKYQAAILTLIEGARHPTGAGQFMRDFLKACLDVHPIDLSEIARLDMQNSEAAVLVFAALGFRCGETRDFIWENYAEGAE